MNEIDRLHAMIAALLEARNHLLSQAPSNLMVISEVTEQMMVLNKHLTEAIASQTADPLTNSDQTTLQQAVNTLNSKLLGNTSQTEVAEATRGLMSIVGRWPPT